jgi:hypothetical protein
MSHIAEAQDDAIARVRDALIVKAGIPLAERGQERPAQAERGQRRAAGLRARRGRRARQPAAPLGSGRARLRFELAIKEAVRDNPAEAGATHVGSSPTRSSGRRCAPEWVR